MENIFLKSNIYQFFVVSFFVPLILFVGCNGVDTKKEWIGTISVSMKMVPEDSGVQTIAYDLSFITENKEKFYLLTSNDVIVKGIQKKKDSIRWDLNKIYRIKGNLVENNEDLEAAKALGFSKIIMASYIETIRDDNIETFKKNIAPIVKSTL